MTSSLRKIFERSIEVCEDFAFEEFVKNLLFGDSAQCDHSFPLQCDHLIPREADHRFPQQTDHQI
jgi:hypothetical protein